MGFLSAIKHDLNLLRFLLRHRVYIKPIQEREIINEFHKLFYYSGYFEKQPDLFWLGTLVLKCPFDLWIYQEIIFERKPDLIIETGTAFGGSTLYLASICDLVQRGRIVTVDIEHKAGRPVHDRITYLHGSSTSDEIVAEISSIAAECKSIMVILDSDHSKDHVLKELMIYENFVTPQNYIIVEDSNINGHPIYPNGEPGPMEAIEEFISQNQNFAIDKSREKLLLTFNPNGYMRRSG